MTLSTWLTFFIATIFLCFSPGPGALSSMSAGTGRTPNVSRGKVANYRGSRSSIRVTDGRSTGWRQPV